ncbi:ribonuclease H-like domain-containing protein, partial [Tanacetum coccineum]
MFAAIETRFGGNTTTKKTQTTLLKQQYANFSASSVESLDSIFNRLQKIVSRLAILGVVIAQEDLNSNFLSSLPPEWNTHVVVWMNKPEVKTMSIDDLYNNFKIVKQKVKKSVGASSGASILDFYELLQTSHTASFSDNAVYAFMVKNPNGSNLLHQDLGQIHKDDLEAMDLKWQLSLLSMRAERYYQRIGKKIFINANDTSRYDESKVECFNFHKMGHFAKECRAPRSKEGQFRNQDNTRKQGNNKDTSSKVMLAIDGVGFDWSDMTEEQVQTNMALMAVSDLRIDLSYSGLDEFKEPEFKGYGPENSEQVSNVGKPQQDDKGFIDSGYSRHMTRNIAYLSDFKEFDRGYVAFGGGAYGGRITEACYKRFNNDKPLWLVLMGRNTGALEKGIKREYSIDRTPQQNGVAERRNRTLIEAARTMLADSKLPTTFWAEVVSTACYVQNRVLASLMAKVMKVSLLDYSLSSKAFRVYNTRTRRVEENLHIGFLENKPMIEGNGPKWLFDIDSLTQSMNYVPVTAGTISNDSAGTSEENSQDCIVMPIWKDTSYFDSPTKDVCSDSSAKDVNVAGQHVNTASPDVNTGGVKLNVVGP